MPAVKRLAAVMAVGVLLLLAAVSFASSASAYPDGTAPTLALDHNSGTVGDHVTVTGAKYLPDADVSLEFHSNPVSLGTVHTDSHGGFTTSITVPDVALGAHSIVGSDSGNESASAAFTVVASGNSDTGGLANTGVAVIGLSAVGAVMLTGGGLMLLAGRRRKVDV
jgi:hypothetical protein